MRRLKAVGTFDTFVSDVLGDVRDGEVLDVQLPQVGELGQLSRKLPDPRITAATRTNTDTQEGSVRTDLSKEHKLETTGRNIWA